MRSSRWRGASEQRLLFFETAKLARGGRKLRVGQEIQRLLAESLRTELKDPRVSALVTITAVDVSPDLRQAKVYVTLLGDEAACESTLDALNRSATFLRRSLAGRMNLRSVPALHFVFDASVGRGARVASLIEAAVRSTSGPQGRETRRRRS